MKLEPKLKPGTYQFQGSNDGKTWITIGEPLVFKGENIHVELDNKTPYRAYRFEKVK